MSDNIISLIVSLALLLLLLLVLVYFFGRWKLRRFVMKKFGEKIGLTLQEKGKKDFELNGDYKGKNIIITESASTMIYGGAFGNVSSKILEIKIDSKSVYHENGEVLFPFPKKIKKIIDNYIDKGSLPKSYKLLKWIIVVSLFILLFYFQMLIRK